MIHHSCDRCQKLIDSENELRYVVNIEIQAAVDPDSEASSQCDQLAELGSLLDQLDTSDCDDIRKHVYQKRRYDLCADCRREYLDNPLSIDRQVEFGFSNN